MWMVFLNHNFGIRDALCKWVVTETKDPGIKRVSVALSKVTFNNPLKIIFASCTCNFGLCFFGPKGGILPPGNQQCSGTNTELEIEIPPWVFRGFVLLDLVHAQSREQCMISSVISAWSANWSVHNQAGDECMIRQVISVWSASWSVHDHPRDQCMCSHVISVWSASWSVYDQPRDQCLIATLPLHDQSCDQCMVSHGISPW